MRRFIVSGKWAAAAASTLAVLAAGLLAHPTMAHGQASGSASRPFTCTVALVTDGDTFRCSETGADGRAIRVRLSGIAARERDGSCSRGHPCPQATAAASTAALERAALGQRLLCRPQNITYGRVAAFCRRSDGVDISCAMVASGAATRWQRYWGAHRC